MGMQDISSNYGNAILGMEEEKPVYNEPTISYRPKQKPEKLPDGAKIKSQTKDIYVQEIENGFLVTIEKTICYVVTEKDGDEEEKYMYMPSVRIYSKEKPVDIKLSI